jgi:hypothetical protein
MFIALSEQESELINGGLLNLVFNSGVAQASNSSTTTSRTGRNPAISGIPILSSTSTGGNSSSNTTTQGAAAGNFQNLTYFGFL